MSPNARSKALLESEGFRAEIVEHRLTRIITKDLFGIIDIVGIRDGSTIGVQATTAANLAARRKKLQVSPVLASLRAANWTIELHAWRKARGRWTVRREVL